MLKEIKTREYTQKENGWLDTTLELMQHVEPERRRRIMRANLEYWTLRSELALEEAENATKTLCD